MSLSIGSMFSASAASTLTGGASAPKAADKGGAQSEVNDFLTWANMNPAQRMRANILHSMGLSEDDLKGMTPEKRKAVEQQIAEKIKQAALEGADKGKTGLAVDVTA